MDRARTWIQDWSWIDLAEDLPWAIADVAALNAYSARLAALAEKYRPLVVYLDIDPGLALERASRQRGPDWTRRTIATAVQVGGPDCEGDPAAAFAKRQPRMLGVIAQGAWPLLMIDATSPAEAVLAEALGAVSGQDTHDSARGRTKS